MFLKSHALAMALTFGALFGTFANCLAQESESEERVMPRQQRLNLYEACLAIAYSDGLSEGEEKILRKLGKRLRIGGAECQELLKNITRQSMSKWTPKLPESIKEKQEFVYYLTILRDSDGEESELEKEIYWKGVYESGLRLRDISTAQILADEDSLSWHLDD